MKREKTNNINVGKTTFPGSFNGTLQSYMFEKLQTRGTIISQKNWQNVIQ